MEEAKADGVIKEPSVRLSEEAAQRLMDQLWIAGVRPSDGEGNIGQIGAVKAHLEDMRKIAFKKLGMKEEPK